MVNNYDRLFNQAQGQKLISVLSGIKSSLDGNYPLENVNVTLSDEAQTIYPSENYYGIGVVNVPAQGGSGNVQDYFVSDNNGDLITGRIVINNSVDEDIYIGNKVTSVAGLFGQPIPESIYYSGSILSFNHNIVFLPNSNCTNLCALLACAYNFDKSIDIPDSAIDCSYMLLNCVLYNGNFNIPDSVTNTYGMFSGTYDDYYGSFLWNFEIHIPNNCINCGSMFSSSRYSGRTLNEQSGQMEPFVTHIPNTVENCSDMFSGNLFNGYVEVDDDCRNITGLLRGAYNYNLPFNFPNNVRVVSRLFESAEIFNQPVVIPNTVTNCYNLFADCYMFNHVVNIPQDITSDMSCYGMFFGCRNLNQIVNYTIPNNVNNCANMFRGCTNLGGNFYINNTSLFKSSIRNMFGWGNNSIRKNVYCNNIAVINGNYSTNSLIGAAITWTSTTNGYYNSVYNIYIYNNYPVT